MSIRYVHVSVLAVLAASSLAGVARAQVQQPAGANVAGSYRCEPEPSPCQAQTMSITQSGRDLELRSEKGPIAGARLTSDITISGGPPWNSLGIVLPDHSIEWSNGTKWRKQ
jgi:hypothetical protein